MDDGIHENAPHENEPFDTMEHDVEEDVGLNEDDDDDDRIPDMVEELYTAEEQGGRNSMFGSVIA